MKLSKLIPVVLTIAMAQSMSSCLKTDNNSYSVNQAYPNLFNAVVDLNDGNVTLYPQQSYKVEWNLINQTANIQVNGLKLPDGASYPTLYFNDVPWKYNSKGWYDITLADYVPSSSSSYLNNLVFTRFNFQTINRVINNLNFPPCLSISYTINNDYKVYTLPMEIIEAGTTTVTASDGTKLELSTSDSDMPIYYLETDPATKKAFLVIQNAKLHKDMDKAIVKITPLTLDVNQVGHITCTGTDIVPATLEQQNGINSAGTPMTDYTINNLTTTYIADYGLTLSFDCKYKDEVYSTQFITVFPQSPQTTN